MPKNLDVQTGVADTYPKRSSRYDGIVKAFNLFRSFGFDIDFARGIHPGATAKAQ